MSQEKTNLEKWQAVGKAMSSLGCLMTVFITIPVCICLALYFLGFGQ